LPPSELLWATLPWADVQVGKAPYVEGGVLPAADQAQWLLDQVRGVPCRGAAFLPTAAAHSSPVCCVRAGL
jgi:hypothetical protein